jgi:hypothetical protein
MDALLAGRIKLTLEPNDKGADYRVLTDTGCEVGAAWTRSPRRPASRGGWIRRSCPGQVALFPAREAGKTRPRVKSPKAQSGLNTARSSRPARCVRPRPDGLTQAAASVPQKSSHRTGLRRLSNRSPCLENGNWKNATRDSRPECTDLARDRDPSRQQRHGRRGLTS